ncbi:hypothetical protein M1307_03835 [Patescibacteria group bacterium]|nr:hypothetical protein [Patescibacteria group bacterium]
MKETLKGAAHRLNPLTPAKNLVVDWMLGGLRRKAGLRSGEEPMDPRLTLRTTMIKREDLKDPSLHDTRENFYQKINEMRNEAHLAINNGHARASRAAAVLRKRGGEITLLIRAKDGSLKAAPQES